MSDPLLYVGAKADSARTTKGERTRARILETALQLFKEHGYEGTTMRAIAEAAEVSLGNTYYYFRSKESLIQAFYGQTHHEHLEACETILGAESGVTERLVGVMRAKVDTLMPYHRFAGILFKTAADPASPLNPFSEESGPVRDESVALFARVLDGSEKKIHPDLQARLPYLLWLYHMGVILFWIHDRSPAARRSYRLAERTAQIVAKMIQLGNLAPLRPLVRHTLALLEELGGPEPTGQETGESER